MKHSQQWYLAMSVLGACGLLLLAVLLQGLRSPVRQPYIWWPGKKSKKIEATVIGVEKLTHTTKDFEEMTGYQIKCQWQDLESQKTYYFLSRILHDDPSYCLKEKIDVYINPDNPQQYVVSLLVLS